MAKKQAELNQRERHEITKMPETLFIEVMDVEDDEPDFDKATENSYMNTGADIDDMADGGIVSEYKLVRRFRKVNETKTHRVPVKV